MGLLNQDIDQLELDVPDRILQNLADTVNQRGFGTAAIFLLEMYKPFSSIAYNFALTSFPLLLPLFGREKIKIAMQVMQSRSSLERLLCLIEENKTEKRCQE